MNMRMDPLQVEVAQQPSQHERVVAAINAMWDRLSPAEKAVRERLNQISAEQALELLGPPQPKGNGAAVPSDPAPLVGET